MKRGKTKYSIPRTHRVVKDDRVGAGQIHADAARPRAEDEQKDARVRVEPLHQLLPILDLGRAVQAQVGVGVHVDEDLEQIEHLGHLREDQAAVPAGLELPQQRVQPLQLAAVELNQR